MNEYSLYIASNLPFVCVSPPFAILEAKGPLLSAMSGGQCFNGMHNLISAHITSTGSSSRVEFMDFLLGSRGASMRPTRFLPLSVALNSYAQFTTLTCTDSEYAITFTEYTTIYATVNTTITESLDGKVSTSLSTTSTNSNANDNDATLASKTTTTTTSVQETTTSADSTVISLAGETTTSGVTSPPTDATVPSTSTTAVGAACPSETPFDVCATSSDQYAVLVEDQNGLFLQFSESIAL